jgi:hypothetical protein
MVLRGLMQGVARPVQSGFGTSCSLMAMASPAHIRPEGMRLNPLIPLNELSRRRGAALFVRLCRRLRRSSLGQRFATDPVDAVVASCVVGDGIHFVQDDRADDGDDQSYRYRDWRCVLHRRRRPFDPHRPETSRYPDVAVRLQLAEVMLLLVDGDHSSTTIALRHRVRRVSNRVMC